MPDTRSKLGRLVLLAIAASSTSWVMLPHASCAQTCVPAPGGLASRWPGDGNTDEIKGGGNGTFVAAAARTPWPGGMLGLLQFASGGTR